MNYGETNLKKLLQQLEPELDPAPYVFCCVPIRPLGDFVDLKPIITVIESEGLTLVLNKQSADTASLNYQGVFRKITLKVHSSLEAVGLTAAFATQLSQFNISANVIAGFYHDHVFVNESDAEKAIEALNALSLSHE